MATHDPFAHPAARVRAAVAAREGAFAAYRHSPNSETHRVLVSAIKAVDYRLDQLWASLTDEQREAVEARPIRHLAHA